MRLFQITNKTFFDKLCGHIASAYSKHLADASKFSAPALSMAFFNAFTIQQLDTIKEILSQKQCNVVDLCTNFVCSYFSKVFSAELSPENQEYMTDEEKLQNLERLYSYAKERNLPKSLVSSLLYEILLLTIKLETYKEELFKEYLELPMEHDAQDVEDQHDDGNGKIKSQAKSKTA